jgi:Flp pilus assembly protein TadD
MTRKMKQSIRLALVLLAIGGAAGAEAQVVQSPPRSSAAITEDPGAALSRHLTTLANNPQSVAALTGAGRAALTLGDAEAALSFFARAEELAPTDGRVKAGMGSALVLMEQGATALQFFNEAARLGVPEAEFAGDRGLALDLSGNPKAAQRDYQLALSRVEDPEIRRRLALSQAIGGDRKSALATIDTQLRRQDRAAWRVQAFVLALTGDTAGAAQTVQAVMPGQAAALQPFLARLPGLSIPERAAAVHFGHFPGDVMASASDAPAAARAAAPATVAAVDAVRAGQPDTSQPALGTSASTTNIASSPGRAAVSAPGPAATSSRLIDTVQVTAAGPRAAPADEAANGPIRIAAAEPAAASLPVQAAISASGPPPIVPQDLPPAAASAAAGPPSQPAPAPVSTPDLSSANVPLRAQSDSSIKNFADVAALVASLPAAEASRETPAAKPSVASKPSTTTTKKAASDAGTKPAKAAPAKPKEPKRIWVQVASGSNASTLPKEYSRLTSKAPKLFARRSAWTTPLRATNRLLVGPFKSEKDAQLFVNELTKAKLSGFSWTSPDGQEIRKLPGK